MVKRVNVLATVLLDDECAGDAPLQLLGVG
jgi:hypothetical protein